MGKKLRILLPVLALALIVFLLVSFGFFSQGFKQQMGAVSDGKYCYSQYNCKFIYTPGEGSKLVSLPWGRDEGELRTSFTVGGREFNISEDETQLLENGQNVIPEGSTFSSSFMDPTEDSLIVRLYDAEGRNETGYLCLTAEHSLVLDDSIKLLCAAGRWAYGACPSGTEAQLCCIDLETGGSWMIAEDVGGVSLAATDGRWLYTYRMWSNGSTSCWELDFDESGRPEGLTYAGEV